MYVHGSLTEIMDVSKIFFSKLWTFCITNTQKSFNTLMSEKLLCTYISFFKENVRYPVWTCRDPISLILGTRFSLILETRWQVSLILGTWIGSLKRLKKTCIYINSQFNHKKFYLAHLIQGLKVEKTIFCRKLQFGLFTKRFSATLGKLCSFV